MIGFTVQDDLSQMKTIGHYFNFNCVVFEGDGGREVPIVSNRGGPATLLEWGSSEEQEQARACFELACVVTYVPMLYKV
jgi:hypothetical protein